MLAAHIQGAGRLLWREVGEWGVGTESAQPTCLSSAAKGQSENNSTQVGLPRENTTTQTHTHTFVRRI